MFGDNCKYDDIINMPHHVSTKHPRMSMEARAAQFAPFSALVGYSDAVDETIRLTDKRIEIDEELKKELDRRLKTIKNNITNKPKATITYFIPDELKDGGKYVTISDNVNKIDEFNKVIILNNKTIIPINDIIEII